MSVIGALSSAITIWLIHLMKTENGGHLRLVLTMSCYQILYDITFFFSNVNCGHYITAAANFFQLLSGIGGSLASNWIAFVAWYVITFRQKPDVVGRFNLVFLSTFVPGLVDALLYFFSVVPQQATNKDLEEVSVLDFYYYLRLASIGVNFVLCIITIYKISLMSSKRVEKSIQERAIENVTRRMIYYPLLQALGRSGYAWYEASYGSNIDPNQASRSQYACLIFLTIVTPLVSVGYLAIFLVMQPSAFQILKSKLRCQASPVEECDLAGPASVVSVATEEAYDLFTNETGSLSLVAIAKPARSSLFDWNRPSSFVGGMFRTSVSEKTPNKEQGERAISVDNPLVITRLPFQSSLADVESKGEGKTDVTVNIIRETSETDVDSSDCS
eukprot:gene10794-11996_t